VPLAALAVSLIARAKELRSIKKPRSIALGIHDAPLQPSRGSSGKGKKSPRALRSGRAPGAGLGDYSHIYRRTPELKTATFIDVC